MSEIIRAGHSDVEVLGQVIADAFFDLPQSRWLVPDPGARRAIFPSYFQIAVEHALASGVVQTTPDRDAAALWIYVKHELPLPPADYLLRLADVTGTWVDRFVVFDAALAQHHPAGEPQHYLNILAVRPDRQGQGIGSSLLSAYHRQLDQAAALPAYLEAADERTRRLYRRHGYAARAEGPFRLPDQGPPMWPMTRPARSRARPARYGLIAE
jgi:GNAT superfamily N-acetyltransferase